jgi:hypothetical protein
MLTGRRTAPFENQDADGVCLPITTAPENMRIKMRIRLLCAGWWPRGPSS